MIKIHSESLEEDVLAETTPPKYRYPNLPPPQILDAILVCMYVTCSECKDLYVLITLVHMHDHLTTHPQVNE